jgi:hypothetical protein
MVTLLKKYCMLFPSNSIPIYWVSSMIIEEFNPKAFINCHDYNTIDDVNNKIQKLDSHEHAYNMIINQPVFLNNPLPDNYHYEYLLSFFRAIFCSLTMMHFAVVNMVSVANLLLIMQNQ